MREIAQLEIKRERLHQYIIDKLEERDYHAIADAAMDLRELEVEIKLTIQLSDIAESLERKGKEHGR
mgnify:CR=1 FL=1